MSVRAAAAAAAAASAPDGSRMRRETRSRPAHALRINGHWSTPVLGAASRLSMLLLRHRLQRLYGLRRSDSDNGQPPTAPRPALPLPLLRFLLFLLRPRIRDITSAAAAVAPKRFQSPLRTEVNSQIAPPSALCGSHINAAQLRASALLCRTALATRDCCKFETSRKSNAANRYGNGRRGDASLSSVDVDRVARVDSFLLV